MKFNKTVWAIMALVMMVSIAACGGKKSNSKTAGSTSSVSDESYDESESYASESSSGGMGSSESSSGARKTNTISFYVPRQAWEGKEIQLVVFNKSQSLKVFSAPEIGAKAPYSYSLTLELYHTKDKSPWLEEGYFLIGFTGDLDDLVFLGRAYFNEEHFAKVENIELWGVSDEVTGTISLANLPEGWKTVSIGASGETESGKIWFLEGPIYMGGASGSNANNLEWAFMYSRYLDEKGHPFPGLYEFGIHIKMDNYDDRSYYPFKERIRITGRNVGDLGNVELSWR